MAPPAQEAFNIEEWKMPPPMQLRVPYYVFGFPITSDDINNWGDKLNLDRNLGMVIWDRGFKAMLQALPQEYRRRENIMSVSFGQDREIMCIVLGSNKSQKDIERAQDLDMIRKVADALHPHLAPGWFRPRP
ncbi:hypothetical protein BDQ17DRAFT_1430959 [Cyathus striatus]|nr:hypothetical protein BDQ17DRAFT_1430959 [Cyathus striatus]